VVPVIRQRRGSTPEASEHERIPDECWRSAFARCLQVRFTGRKRELADYLACSNDDRVHTGGLTRVRTLDRHSLRCHEMDTS
jgi:hypothetical protein